MSTLEIPNKNLDNTVQDINQLLESLAKKTKDINDDPLNDFEAIQTMIQQANELAVPVSEFKEKFIGLVAKYYDEKIPYLLGRLEESVDQAKPEAYLLFMQVGKLLEESKKFGVEVLEQQKKYNELEQLAFKKIKL